MMDITREDGPTEGRYVARIDGQEAELVYAKAADGTLIADHTGVPPALEGRGIAHALVDRLIADARQQGFKIVPACSFVAAQFRNHPDWSDLVA